MKNYLEHILSIPTSFYASWRLMGFKNALRLPIWVKWTTYCRTLKGKVVVTDGIIKPGLLRFGFDGVGTFDPIFQRGILEISGTIILHGHAQFGNGARVCVMKNATLELGEKFNNSAGMTITCGHSITIGDSFLSSWETALMDTDLHHTMDTETGEVHEMVKPIVIGNNVWMGMKSVVLKGVTIPNNCIIAAGTVVAKKNYCDNNSLIVGPPCLVKNTHIKRIED